MEKKVLMVNPPTGLFIRDDRCQSDVGNFLISVTRPPHELLTMAAVLEGHGYEVIIRDYPIEKKSVWDYELDLKEILPDILVINGTIPTLKDDIACAQIAKKIKKDLIVILRCGMIENIAGKVMENESSIDAVFYGETDFTLYEFLEYEDKNRVRGVFYRYKGSISKTDKRPFLKDLDAIPIVNRGLIKNELYKRPDNGRPLGLIEVSRGCPYQCIFCLTSFAYGKDHRRRSVEKIIEEIELCNHEHNIFDFHFKSDLFSLDRKWVIDLCRGIIDKNLKIRWFANSRVDTLDDHMLNMMKESGCFALSLGVESSSQYILDKIKKDITVSDIEEAFSLCRKNGIQTYAYFIIGFPWDTEDTIGETISFSRKIAPDYLDFFLPSAFEGTELFQIIKENGLIDNYSASGVSRDSYTGSQCPTLSLTRERLIELRKKALRGFYVRPGYVLERLKLAGSFRERMCILRYGISSLSKIIG
ncbi:B12-binding domain-containing radical SAM protein [Candidatus Omnitrophota bacterium]